MDNSKNVNEDVHVTTKVTVTPDGQVGDVESVCVGEPNTKPSPGKQNDSENEASQLINVRLHLDISATDDDAKPADVDVACDSCEPEPLPTARKCTQNGCMERRCFCPFPLPVIIALLCCCRR